MSIDAMRFRAAITIEFEAEDYRTAGEQQEAIKEVFEHLREKFRDSSLTVAQRRFARRPQATTLQRHRVRNGAIPAYDD